MKKGVAISLFLAFAVCIPAVAQPSSKAVETIVIDDFDSDQEWEWDVQSSRFVADGYPIVKKFDGMPNSLKAYHNPEDPAQVLGVKVKYNRKGENWFEVFPKAGDGSFEPAFRGTVSQIDFWVWGANYNYYLEVMLRDATGRVHVLQAGSLAFNGWKNIVVNIPGWLQQHSHLRSGPENMTFVGFRVRSDAEEYVDNYVIFFDQMKYTTNSLSFIFDGYEMKDVDFGESSGEGEAK